MLINKRLHIALMSHIAKKVGMNSLAVPIFNLLVSADIGYLIVHANFPYSHTFQLPLPQSNTRLKKYILFLFMKHL